jgi:peptide/nickel transport system substrate-binding protein
VARSYSISENGRVYTFSLRNDVFFHNNDCFEGGRGRRVIAKDFVYSFTRLFDSKVSSATSLLTVIDRDEKSGFSGFKAPDDSTFIIYLKQPFSAFASLLTMKYFSVVPFEAIDKYGIDFRKNPVGTGPFLFRHWYENNKLVLIKNPYYFEKDENGNQLPYIDAMTVSFMRDRETAFMELLNGKFDMLSGADAFNTNEVLDKEGELRDFYRKKFILQKETYLKTDYIGILVDEEIPIVKESPLRLKKVRQAVNYAIDRDKLIKYLRNNLGTAAHWGFIPPGLKSFDSSAVKGYHYDPAKCASLLAEAGFPHGEGLPEITLHITEQFREQVEFIQSQLAQQNIRIQISVEKTPVLRQAVNNGEYVLFKKSWVADYADEENFMSLFYSKNFSPGGVNFFHYKNENFDRLFEQALSENDESKKSRLYQQMDQLICDDAPVITLYYDQVIRLVSHRVKNLPTNPLNLLDLRRVRLN